MRPLRWLIIPALALGLGAGTAVAAGVQDVGGSTGERVYRPAIGADIQPLYELAAGHLVVDLRGDGARPASSASTSGSVPGRPRSSCPRAPASRSTCTPALGGFDIFGEGSGGIDADRVEGGRTSAGTPRVAVQGDVGLGAVTIAHAPGQDSWNHATTGGTMTTPTGNACIGDAGAQG